MVEHDPEELLAGALEAIAEVAAESGRASARSASRRRRSPSSSGSATPGGPSRRSSAGRTSARASCARRSPNDRRRPPIRAKTGLALDPTFSAPKLAWLFAADPALRDRAEAGELLFGDVACWLAWHLCGGAAHVTEPSNACRSLLVDLETLALGRRAARPVRGARGAAARDQAVRRSRASRLRRGRLRGAARGDAGRPAGGALRPGLHLAADGRAHAGHGRLPVAERRRRPAGAAGRRAGHGGVDEARLGLHVRARGLLRERRQRAGPAPVPGLCGRRCDAAAPTGPARIRSSFLRRRASARRTGTAQTASPCWARAARPPAADLAAAASPASPTRSPTRSRPSTRAAPRTSFGSAAGSPRTKGCFRPWPTSPGQTLEVARRPGGDRPRHRRTRRGGRGPARRGRGRRHAIARTVAPRLDDGGRARERSRWADALEVHVRAEA